MADLAFRSQTFASDVSFTVDNIDATLPAGTVANDLMVIFFTTLSLNPAGIPTQTTPSGWTLAGTTTGTNLNGLDCRTSCFYKVAGGSEGTVNCAANMTCAISAERVTYDNVNTGSPFHTIVTGSETGATVSFVISSITTTAANELLLAFCQALDAITWTPAGGMTERQDTSGLGVFDVVQAAAGASGTKTQTTSATSVGLWMMAAFNSEAATTTPVPSTPDSVPRRNKPAGIGYY